MEDEYSLRKERLHSKILAGMPFDREMEDAAYLSFIDSYIQEEAKQAYIPLKEMLRLRQELFYSLRRLDLLSELLEEDDVTEIMVNGYRDIFVEKKGKIKRYSKAFDSEEKLRDVIQQIVSSCNRMVNETHPVVDARLPDGSRVNVVLPPVALNGAVMTIRRFPKEPMTMEGLVAIDSLSCEAADILALLVRAGYNIFISGGTGSGKTTFLNALSGYIPSEERVITIEDAAELQLQGIPNLVRLEARNANVEGENAVTITDLIKASLRMRPTRLIVGEVRDGAALDMLTAMNTGHDGSLSTGHANSARDMLSRLETMVLMAADMPIGAIQSQIASALDIIVHLTRLRDRRRCVSEICEISAFKDGDYQLETLFRFEESGQTEKGGVEGRLHMIQGLTNTTKLKREGLFEDYKKIKERALCADKERACTHGCDRVCRSGCD